MTLQLGRQYSVRAYSVTAYSNFVMAF